MANSRPANHKPPSEYRRSCVVSAVGSRRSVWGEREVPLGLTEWSTREGLRSNRSKTAGDARGFRNHRPARGSVASFLGSILFLFFPPGTTRLICSSYPSRGKRARRLSRQLFFCTSRSAAPKDCNRGCFPHLFSSRTFGSGNRGNSRLHFRSTAGEIRTAVPMQ